VNSKPAKILSRMGLLDYAAVFFLAAVVLLRPGWANDPGVGWHIRSGEWMLSAREILRVDPFLSGASRPWINDQWLSDILLFALTSVGGFPLAHAIFGGICVATYFWIVAGLLSRLSASVLAVALVLLLAASAGSMQWILRPVVLSFLFFALVYRLCYSDWPRRADLKAKESAFKRWSLPVIFVFWANCHPAFVLGLVVVAVRLASQALGCLRKQEATWALIQEGTIFLLCVLGTLATPYGFALYQNSFALGSSQYFMNLNVEWAAPDIWTLIFAPFFFSLIVLTVLALRVRGKGLGVAESILLVMFLAAALFQRRYIPYFSVVSAAPLLKLLEANLSTLSFRRSALSPLTAALSAIDVRQRTKTSMTGFLIIWALLAAAVLVFGRLPFRSTSWSEIMMGRAPQALSDLVEEQLGGRVFHSPDLGGLITWRLWPRIKASIDDRNILSGESAYRDFFRVRKGEFGWKEYLESNKFGQVLLEREAPLIRLLSREPDWLPVFDRPDETIVLYRHRGAGIGPSSDKPGIIPKTEVPK